MSRFTSKTNPKEPKDHHDSHGDSDGQLKSIEEEAIATKAAQKIQKLQWGEDKESLPAPESLDQYETPQLEKFVIPEKPAFGRVSTLSKMALQKFDGEVQEQGKALA